MTTATPPCKCPCCNYSFQSCTEVHGADAFPKVGDFSMCVNCGVILIHGHELTLRVAKAFEIERLKPQTTQEMRQLQGLIRARGPISLSLAE